MWEPDDTREAEIDNLEVEGGPSPGDAMVENFEPYAYTMKIGPDGLPVEDTPPWQSADTAPIPLTPETVQCLPQPPGHFTPEGVSACRYYKRQRVHNPRAPDKPILNRLCTHDAVRGMNGACMVLDDAGIFECELRDPPDPRSKMVLDLIDHHKMLLGRKRLEQEVATGSVHGYRLFRTKEDVDAGRFTLEENDVSVVKLGREPTKVPDPFAPDDDGEDASLKVDAHSETQPAPEKNT